MNLDLHGIAHRRELHDCHPGSGNDTHIQKMLTQGALASDLRDQECLPLLSAAKRSDLSFAGAGLLTGKPFVLCRHVRSSGWNPGIRGCMNCLL